MLNAIKRRLAIRSYRTRLGAKLRERYGGGSRRYTTAQVTRTVEECGFNTGYLSYALFMYCEREDFTEYQASRGENLGYDDMQHLIGSGPSGYDVTPSEASFTHESSPDSRGSDLESSDAGTN